MTFKCINTIVHYIPDPYTRHPYSVESWVCYPLIPAEFLAARRGKVAAKCWLGRHLLRGHFFQISIFLLKKPSMIRFKSLPNPSQFLVSCCFFRNQYLTKVYLKKNIGFQFSRTYSQSKNKNYTFFAIPKQETKIIFLFVSFPLPLHVGNYLFPPSYPVMQSEKKQEFRVQSLKKTSLALSCL